MDPIEFETLAEKLEPLVDRHGIATVLEALAVVTALKADHIATNWGDNGLARLWESVASKIGQATQTAKQHNL